MASPPIAIESMAIGTFGSLKLLKNKAEGEYVACFPIDEDELTFGRNPECGVRLYYPTVSLIHCKIVFRESKALLVVLGSNGLSVDGCKVFPSLSTEHPTTVPLNNGSIVEIQRKRFEFNYPPKQHRVQPPTTPFPSRRRSLRMSMIQAAQVFTPTGSRSRTPENEITMLKSPVKSIGVDDGKELVVTVLEGNAEDSIVLEDGKDLIVLEEVENQRPPPVLVPSMSHSLCTPPRQMTPTVSPPHTTTRSQLPKPVNTPRRRSEPSLHRAVLVRSAQRAFLKQQEEEREEQEVEIAVSPDHFVDEGEDLMPRAIMPTNVQEDVDEEDIRVDMEQSPIRNAPKGTIRKSLEVVRKMLPFNWITQEESKEESSIQPDIEGPNMQDSSDEDDEMTEIQIAVISHPQRTLGPFMTPRRIVQTTRQPRVSMPMLPSTPSHVGGARRVPMYTASDEASRSIGQVRLQEAWKPLDTKDQQSQMETPKPPIVTEEERRDILEKRKSVKIDERFDRLPPVGDWSAKPPSRTIVHETTGNDNLEDLLARVREQADDMRRKSLARQAQPRLSMSPNKKPFSAFVATMLSHPDEEESNTSSTPLHSGSRLEFEEETEKIIPAPAHLVQQAEGSKTPRFVDFKQALVKQSSLATPRFDGIRALFPTNDRLPVNMPVTPAMKSMRNLFKLDSMDGNGLRSPEIIATKEFLEGVEEIEESDAAEVEIELTPKTEVAILPSLLTKPTPPQSSLPQRRGRSAKTVLATVVGDAARSATALSGTTMPPSQRKNREDEEQVVDKATLPPELQNRPVLTKRIRTRGVKTEVTDQESVESPIESEKQAQKSASGRGRSKIAARKKSPVSSPVAAAVDDDDELDGIARPASPETATPRARKTLRSRSTTNQEVPKKAPTKRTRHAKTDTEETDDDKDTKPKKTPTTTGRAAGRKTRSKTAVFEQVEDENEKENSPDPKAQVAGRSANKRGKKVATPDAVDPPPAIPRATRARTKK